VDEKSQVQALNRTQKTLPMQPGHTEPHDLTWLTYGGFLVEVVSG